MRPAIEDRGLAFTALAGTALEHRPIAKFRLRGVLCFAHNATPTHPITARAHVSGECSASVARPARARVPVPGLGVVAAGAVACARGATGAPAGGCRYTMICGKIQPPRRCLASL